MRNGLVAIYGLFAVKTGFCLYVGRTKNPRSREQNHRTWKNTNGQPFLFRIIKRVPALVANREERKVIARYAKRGEASLNFNGRDLLTHQHMATLNIGNALHKKLKTRAVRLSLPLKDVVSAVIRSGLSVPHGITPKQQIKNKH